MDILESQLLLCLKGELALMRTALIKNSKVSRLSLSGKQYHPHLVVDVPSYAEVSSSLLVRVYLPSSRLE